MSIVVTGIGFFTILSQCVELETYATIVDDNRRIVPVPVNIVLVEVIICSEYPSKNSRGDCV